MGSKSAAGLPSFCHSIMASYGEAEPSAADFYFGNSVGGAGAAPEQLGGRFANTRYRRRNADNG
jgi:hypothetical protein